MLTWVPRFVFGDGPGGVAPDARPVQRMTYTLA
jgi:hypothetical protein